MTALATVEASAVAGETLRRLQAAWNAADGEAFGAVYAPDASFVNIRGEHVVGRGAIAAGHAAILRTVYAGSTNVMELLRAEEIAPGVVLAVSLNTLDAPAGPLAGKHRATSTSVIAADPADPEIWHVVTTHNTLLTA